MKRLVLITLLFLFGSAGLAFAQSSDNYRIDEQFIGPGASRDSSSTNYEADSTVGDLGAGEYSSPNYQAQFGFDTEYIPRLGFAVNSSNVNLGELTTNVTKTGTAEFQVLNYTSHGYVVQTVGEGLRNGSYVLNNMSTTTSSQQGTEQFGINLVANTDPATFGADPEPIPDSSFSFGEAGSSYNTADKYRYVEGETIAKSDQESGQTNFTISYIANVSSTTPGGAYVFNQALVATSTY